MPSSAASTTGSTTWPCARRRAAAPDAIEPAEQPIGPGRPGTPGMEGCLELAIVGDHQDRRGRGRPVDRAGLLDQREQDGVGGPRTGVADPQPRRDALVAQPSLARPVEDDIDADRGRDRATQPTDQRRPRRGTGRARHREQQVRAVHEQPLGLDEGIGGPDGALRHRPHRTRAGAAPRRPARRATSPAPLPSEGEPPPAGRSRRRRLPRRRPGAGRGRGPCRSRGPWRRRRVRDQQLDALPRRLRHPPLGDGRADHRRDRGLVRPRDRDPHRQPRAGRPARAGPRRGRARARAARRGPRRRDRRAMPPPGCTRRGSTAGRRPARRTRW